MAFFSRAGSILRQAAASRQIINVELSSSKPKASIFQAIRCFSSEGSSKLFIGGLSWGTDEDQLREAFSKYGQIVDAKVIVDRETGRSRGFGFVTYNSSEEAASAIQALDGQALHGRNVRVNYATERAPRNNFGGGGGYGGGYNSGYGGGGYGGGGYRNDNYGGGNYGPPSGNYGGGNDGGYGGNFGGASAGGYGNNTGAYGEVAGDVGNSFAGTGEGSGLEGGADFEFGKGSQTGNDRDEEDDGDLVKRA